MISEAWPVNRQFQCLRQWSVGGFQLSVVVSVGGQSIGGGMSNAMGTASSAAAVLTVNEAVPALNAQPVDRSAATGNSVSFAVLVNGVPTIFGF